MTVTRMRNLILGAIFAGALSLGGAELIANTAPCEYNPPAGVLGSCDTTAECAVRCDKDPYNGNGGVCNFDNCCICY